MIVHHHQRILVEQQLLNEVLGGFGFARPGCASDEDRAFGQPNTPGPAIEQAVVFAGLIDVHFDGQAVCQRCPIPKRLVAPFTKPHHRQPRQHTPKDDDWK